MSMQPDDTAPSRLDSNCQRCQAVVTLTDVHKVSEQLRREFEVASCDVEAAGASLAWHRPGQLCMLLPRATHPCAGFGFKWTSECFIPGVGLHIAPHTTIESCITRSCAAGHEGSLASSYVDVNTAGPSTSAVTRVAGKPSGHQNLTHILELATTQTHVDHPLCAKCLDNVARELQDEAQAAEEQAHAYEEALATLQACRPAVLLRHFGLVLLDTPIFGSHTRKHHV